MLELGPSAAGFHAELGALAAASGVGFLVAVGEHAQDILSGARSGVWEGRGFAAADSGEAIGLLKGTLKQNDWVLVKGSRGIALERVVDAIVGGEGIA
jgi:UDP-N-acetylmuramyl pentapeptide synthase